MRDPYLTEVSPSAGTDAALLFVKGLWSKKDVAPRHTAQWVKAIRAAGWKGSVHHLWWDACTTRGVVTRLLNAWKTPKRRAERVGELWLATLLAELGPGPVTLLGHSLGARVIHSGLLAGVGETRVQDVVFLGGVVRRKQRRWKEVGAAIDGRVINVFNRKDPTLRRLRRARPLSASHCGRNEIEASNIPQIVNYNATDFLGSGHSSERYLRVLPTLVRDTTMGW